MNVAALSRIGASSSNAGMNTPLTRGKLNSQLGMFDEQANLEPSRGSNAFGVRRDYRRGILSLLECKLCGKTFSRITHFHVESKLCEDNEIVHPSMKIGEQGVLESIMVPLSSNAEAISSLSRGTLNSNAGESRARKARKWKK